MVKSLNISTHQTPTTELSKTDLLASRVPARPGSLPPSPRSRQGPIIFCAVREATLAISQGCREDTVKTAGGRDLLCAFVCVILAL